MRELYVDHCKYECTRADRTQDPYILAYRVPAQVRRRLRHKQPCEAYGAGARAAATPSGALDLEVSWIRGFCRCGSKGTRETSRFGRVTGLEP